MLLADIVITRDDFERCDWQEVIASCEDKECVTYSTRFFAKAREVEQLGDTKAQGVFVLLGALTSLSPNLDPKEQPFHPKVVLQNYRSAVLADIRDAQLDVLREVAPQIIDPEMRARIGDILWVRKRDFRMAQLAIEAYLASATHLEDPQSWPPCEWRIKRAVQLAASLGRTGEYFSKTLAHVEAVLNKYNAEDPRFLSAKMMEILLTYRPRDASKYAALAEKAASRAEAERDWHRARTYWKLTARWRGLEKEMELERAALIREGETYVKEAEEAVDRMPPGYLEASIHLPKAIEALRRIGGSQERVDELHRRLLDYQGQSLRTGCEF